MTDRELFEQALEALENPWKAGPDGVANAITALRERLAQPDQDQKPPVKSYCGGKPNYCTPEEEHMKEEIIKMAREAGAGEPLSMFGRTDYVVMTRSELERFYQLAVASERERIIAANAPEIERCNAYIKMLEDELRALREFSAGRCTIQKVIDELGPMSLWSYAGMEKKLDEVRAEEREACAKVCDELQSIPATEPRHCAEDIRARGQQ